MLAAFAILACSGFAGKTDSGKKQIAELKSFPNSFAILELFTSEGCSSCPPADRLLPQLAASNSNIIPLSFHVDYWDRLGWRDPFSNSKFTDRQRLYASQFHLESIYTPQLIINGEYELVGSNRVTANTDINKALNKKPAVQITIDEVKREKDKLLVSCSLQGDLQQTEFQAALVQKHAEIKVNAGENSGAKLSHTNVVRSFLQERASEKMTLKLDIPKDLTDDNRQLILYTQQKKDLRITGVAVSDKWQ